MKLTFKWVDEKQTVSLNRGELHAKNDSVTVTNTCDTDNRGLFLYKLLPYLLK